MAAPVLQVRRGALSNLPGLRVGEPAFTTDTFDFYVGLDTTTDGNKFVGSHRYWTKETVSKGSGVNLVEAAGGSDYITLAAPASVGAAVTYYFPATQGGSQTVLTNDGSGNLSWSSGSLNAVFSGITTIGGDFFDVNVDSDFSGITTFSNTTDNTLGDPNTGAVQIDGGVGIEKNLTVGAGLSVAGQSHFIGTATFYGGTINLGNEDTDDIVVAGEFKSSLIPSDDASYDIGNNNAPKRWRHASFSGIGTFATGLVADNVRLGIGGNGVVDTTSGPLYLDSAIGNTIINDKLDVLGDIDVQGNVYIGGTTVSLRAEEVYIQNRDIVLGFTTSVTPSDTTANHGGIAIASTEGSPLADFTADPGINTFPSTYKQLMWFKSGTLGFSTDAFAFNYGLAVGTTSMANGVRLAVGSGITMSDTEISATDLNLSGNLTVDGNTTLGDSGSDIITIVGVTTFTTSNVYIDNQLYVGGVNIIGGASIGEDISARNLLLTGIATVPTLVLSGTPGIGITGISTSTSLVEDSDAYLPTQKAVKAYIDAIDVDDDLGIAGDTGAGTVDLDTQSLGIYGTANEIQTVGSGTSITIGLPDTVNITTLLDVPTIEVTNVKAKDGTTAITITDSTGAVGFANSVTVNGDLYVFGTTTEVNTSSLKVEDTLIDLGLVNDNGSLVPPTSDLNLDIGVLLNWYNGSAKKASVFWDDSAGRVGIASDVTESSGVLTVNNWAEIEIGALWVNDCAGQSQVISCSGSERFLNNITVDAGTF